jgi:hypothetical protein
VPLFARLRELNESDASGMLQRIVRIQREVAMRRAVYRRDFTVLRAALLAGLIGLAALLGGVPQSAPGLAVGETPGQAEGPLPAAMPRAAGGCDAGWAGVAL